MSHEHGLRPRTSTRALALVFAGLASSSCAGGERATFWRDSRQRLIVAGPMLGPAADLETLTPQLCARIRELPGATAGNRVGGQEYCGAIYQRPGNTHFFASYPSTLSPPVELPGGRKACFPPEAVSDAEAGEVRIHADYHSHPAITRFSPEDLQARRQRFYFRAMFNPLCEVYLYDFQNRTVYQLTHGEFTPLKKVADDFLGE